MSAVLSDQAPAKVNLTLRILGRRADGYHELESLVVFARLGDRLTLDARTARSASTSTGRRRRPRATSPTISCCAPPTRWRRSSTACGLGRFALTKHLPVAAGLGGGSADAAAALRLLARLNELAQQDPRLIEAARQTGADVPVCLEPRARLMRGIGEILSAPLDLPALAGRAGQSGRGGAHQGRVRQARPAQRRDAAGRPTRSISGVSKIATPLWPICASQPNDLERPAVALQPVIARRCLPRWPIRRAARSPACRARGRPASACSDRTPKRRRPRRRSRPPGPPGGSPQRS